MTPTERLEEIRRKAWNAAEMDAFCGELVAELERWNELPKAIHDLDASFPADHINPPLGIAASYALMNRLLDATTQRAESAESELARLKAPVGDYARLLAILDAQAIEIAKQGIAGWGNATAYAAAAIRRLESKRREDMRKCEELCYMIHETTGECPELAVYCAQAIRAAFPDDFKEPDMSHEVEDDLDCRPRGDKPCPACPDGSVWTNEGPTAKVCPVCNGYATVHLDGTPIADRYGRKQA